jgi:hypothetical protein
LKPGPECALLAEEHLSGDELCIDTVTIDNEPRFHSLCVYRPTILDALDDPQVQWRCVMPRDSGAERYRGFTDQGLAAARALAVGNAMTHMEGFLGKGRVCLTDATLRPAGARISPMLAFAYGIDPYEVWARAAVDGCFDGPWERKYAVGTVFLRGTGRAAVRSVEGIDNVRLELGQWLVDSRLPRKGAPKSRTYTGDGYITVRHPQTEMVEAYLNFISTTIVIRYDHDDIDGSLVNGLPERWLYGRGNLNRQHCRPAWEDDSLRRAGDL